MALRVTDFLPSSCVRVPLLGTTKQAVITELIDLLHAGRHLADRNLVLQAVLNREKVQSTGVGEGLAVPHAKSPGCPKLVFAVGKPPFPLDFESADGRPCRMVVLLAGPVEGIGPHLQALAGISRLWLTTGFRQAALQAETAEALYTAFQAFQP
jgi:mannitol/fructose-specific phosphotransferase system IIA component (Ntr-type)